MLIWLSVSNDVTGGMIGADPKTLAFVGESAGDIVNNKIMYRVGCKRLEFPRTPPIMRNALLTTQFIWGVRGILFLVGLIVWTSYDTHTPLRIL